MLFQFIRPAGFSTGESYFLFEMLIIIFPIDSSCAYFFWNLFHLNYTKFGKLIKFCTVGKLVSFNNLN